MKVILFIFLQLAFFISCSFGQSIETNPDLKRGLEVINASRKVVYKGIKQEDIKGFYLKKEITLATGGNKEKQVKTQDMQRVSMEKELHVHFPFKVKSVTKAQMPSINDTQNFFKTEITTDGDKVSFRNVSILDGEEIDHTKNSKEKEKNIEVLKKLETKNYVQAEVWSDVYPLLLHLNWDKERKYKYLGKAKMGGTLADIVEYLPTEKEKNQIKIKTRLLFDEKTKLLLMILSEISDKEGDGKYKYFFSDYQEMEGMLVAKKINTEVIITKKDGSQQRTIQRILVKDFKINPVFKESTFDVKKR